MTLNPWNNDYERHQAEQFGYGNAVDFLNLRDWQKYGSTLSGVGEIQRRKV